MVSLKTTTVNEKRKFNSGYIIQLMNQGGSNYNNELILVYKKLALQIEEEEKRTAELFTANVELAFQNQEKENRAAELIVANKELESFTYQVMIYRSL